MHSYVKVREITTAEEEKEKLINLEETIKKSVLLQYYSHSFV
jgi:hypothetical protein